MKVVVHGVPTPLDVFLMMQKSGMIYAMTLMAFCGFHRQKKMVQLLLDEGASKYWTKILQLSNSTVC